MSTAPQRHSRGLNEVRNVAIDMRGKLDAGELLAGVPTVTGPAGAGSFSNVAINVAPLAINGVTVAIAEAVQFKSSGGSAGTYTLEVTVTTTANPAQTLVEHVVLTITS